MAATIPGYYSRESEFQGGLTGACGPNALAMAASRAQQRYVGTLAVVRLMQPRGLCSPNGISNMGALQAAAKLLSLPITGYQPYAGDTWRGWQSFLDAALARGPVVLEVANGQALRDAITGQGEAAVNLHYHFIAVLGKDSAGRYLCADGDNRAVGNVLQTYAPQVLQAAAPCAALAIAQVAQIVVPVAPPPAWVVVKGPDGSDWYQQTATGHKCGGGLYAALVKQGWQALPLRCTETSYGNARWTAVAVGSGQNAACHVLVWDHQTNGLLLGYDADVAAALLAQYRAA